MTDQEYLKAILEEQILKEGSDELSALRARRKEVEDLLRNKFGFAPSVKYGGSYKKGTMNRESYDLDITCYFPHDDTSAGTTLKEIHDSVREALAEEYFVQSKGSAIRLLAPDGKVDFHIDAVPGRYVEGDDGDVFLYRSSGDKERLRTNLDVHIDHVKDSGVVPAIRLMKLWGERNHVGIKTFGLELLVIDLLKGRKAHELPDQLAHVLEELRDRIEELSIKDPANEHGNDLSDLLNATVRANLQSAARATLETVERDGWQSVFGELEKQKKAAALAAMAATATVRPKPYHGGQTLV